MDDVSVEQSSSLMVETMLSTDFTHLNRQDEEENDSVDDDFHHDDSDDDYDNSEEQEYTSQAGKLLIYADKFIRNELIEIMEYLKNADKDRPVEEVKVHEIYL
ncbi:hypothetical protein PPL_05567 [Heterostelium album PN500]|uniref:Uncharacterized protein n=1 Tax=Heterostelium pallidum (strain ATCC 26659 / Pp 5 / PN500) TaxID=670386 RepID=D3BAI9_HETP5|nr:hypothetical protein PPL_05567 [Heterostelium album PN500]EFA81576.1 hypothetical protein PPL_05567 [Heterostelium album PN500]|eukprot:XP_020433693.1 hypothetical protein PPL_05567 [Heterostelium album PN500]